MSLHWTKLGTRPEDPAGPERVSGVYPGLWHGIIVIFMDTILPRTSADPAEGKDCKATDWTENMSRVGEQNLASGSLKLILSPSRGFRLFVPPLVLPKRSEYHEVSLLFHLYIVPTLT